MVESMASRWHFTILTMNCFSFTGRDVIKTIVTSFNASDTPNIYRRNANTNILATNVALAKGPIRIVAYT
jgi:hypothetical protein